MTKSTRATQYGAIGALVLIVGTQSGRASEPGNFGNFLAGSSMGASIAAAPPPGLFFASTAFYIPVASGNGNMSCGGGCKTRYSAAGVTGNLIWSTDWKFLGASYYPTIAITGLQTSATTTPYPPGGGVLDSPTYNNVVDHLITNIYFNPLNFSWNLGKGLFVAAGLGFIAPTGTSYAGALVPDYWTVRPHAAVSYLGDGWNLTASLLYDINTASRGNTGVYQIIARNPATPAALATFLTGPANPGQGYTSGNYAYLDLTATKKFDRWEFGPVGFVKYQTSNDAPGGVNPATSAAWTCQQLTAAKLPTCGKELNIGAGFLVGYNFGPVDMKFIYANGFYTRDSVDAPTGSTFFFKTSFKLWSPDDAPKTHLITKN